MHTTEAFDGVGCLDCERTFDAETATHRCPECGGPLEAIYEDLAGAHEQVFDGRTANADVEPAASSGGLAQFGPALPFSGDALVTLTTGSTPLVECPTLEAECGLDRVLLKDEGRNPTGALADREMAVAVTAAREHGASTVALPTTGNDGQAAAAFASRADIESEAFAPSRMAFQNKAMINVHGGEMTIVGGRYPDAVGAFEDARADTDWYSLAPFDTPYRLEGAKTLAYELLADLGEAPDAIVHPTGRMTGLVGLARGFRELRETDTIQTLPRLYAAQPSGCAPLVTAWEQDTPVTAVEHPDAICGSLEIPDPRGGAHARNALEETDGGAVGPTDEQLLEAALSLAQAGVPASATGGTAVAGATTLAEQGAFGPDETLVIINPATVNREADLLRSHLMRKGI